MTISDFLGVVNSAFSNMATFIGEVPERYRPLFARFLDRNYWESFCPAGSSFSLSPGEMCIRDRAYSWSMSRVSIPALDISEDSTIMQGISEIKWNKKRKVETNYGRGGDPVSYTHLAMMF